MMKRILLAAGLLVSSLGFATVYVEGASNETCVQDVLDQKRGCFKIIDETSFFITEDQLEILKTIPHTKINVEFAIVDSPEYLELPESFMELTTKKPKKKPTKGGGVGNGNGSSNGNGNGNGNTIIIALPGSTVIIGPRGGGTDPEKPNMIE